MPTNFKAHLHYGKKYTLSDGRCCEIEEDTQDHETVMVKCEGKIIEVLVSEPVDRKTDILWIVREWLGGNLDQFIYDEKSIRPTDTDK